VNTLRDTFDDIYRGDLWNGGSGPGSHPVNTWEYVAWINDFIRLNKSKTFLDVGCGDFQMFAGRFLEDIAYIGIDESEEAIVRAVENSRPDFAFSGRLRVFGRYPIFECVGPFDIVHIKDVLQHLPFDECKRILEHAKKIGRTVIVTNEYPPCSHDIEPGGYRPIDVTLPPVSFETPSFTRIFNTQNFSKITHVFTFDKNENH
jgi:SAM-dependent methyltransferase